MERMGKISTQVATASSPVVRRRELAALLRELRTESGLTVEEVAEGLLCSPSKVSRMETGQRAVSLRDVRDLCALYEVSDPALREHLTTLAKKSKEQGWWQHYDLPSSFATYIGLEADAMRISNYEPGVVPGLLQTPEYARSVAYKTYQRLSDEGIDKRIEVLVGRQGILTRVEPSPPVFQAVVDEAALRRVVGSAGIMGAALERVIQASDLPNVQVRVLPFAAGAHPALDSTFVLLELPDPLGPMVYVEGLVGRLWLESPPDGERYKQVFERLQGVSLTEQDSVDLLKKLAAEYKHS